MKPKGGYSIASLLWTNLVVGASKGSQIDEEGFPPDSGKSIVTVPIEILKKGFQEAGGQYKAWPKRLWVDMAFTVGSLRAPVPGIRASFAIVVNKDVVASAEFMSTKIDHWGSVSCRFARIYDGDPRGEFFRGKDAKIDLRAGWKPDGVRHKFFVARSDAASTNLIVSIYEYVDVTKN